MPGHLIYFRCLFYVFVHPPTPLVVRAWPSHSPYMCPFVWRPLHAPPPILLIDCRKSNPTASSSASLANQLLMGSDVSPPRGGPSSLGPGSASTPLTGGGEVPPEIPKSPPKWPLRPGVLAYVKGDTKQNICAARNGGAPATMNQSGTATATTTTTATTPGSATTTAVTANESALNKSTASRASSGNNANAATRDSNKQHGTDQNRSSGSAVTSASTTNPIDGTVLAPGDRVLRKALKTIVLSEDVAIQVEGDDDDDDEDEARNGGEGDRRAEDEEETHMDELINFTNSNFINRILKRLRWKRQGTTGNGRRGSGGGIGFDNRRSGPSETAKKMKKSRRRLLLLRKLPKNGLFGSWKSTNSHTELFDSTRNRPAGIKYPSSGNWLCFVYFTPLRTHNTTPPYVLDHHHHNTG